MTIDDPIDLPRLKHWLLSITSLRGPSILRIKGIVNIRSIPGPVVIQGVLYPPVVLDGWPDDDRRSRIVFITEGLAAGAIETTRPYLTGSQ